MDTMQQFSCIRWHIVSFVLTLDLKLFLCFKDAISPSSSSSF